MSHSKPARRQSPVQAGNPAPAGKRAPVAAEARAKHKRALAAARVRRCKKRKRIGELILPAVAAQDEKVIRLLRALGMKSLSEDADRSEIIAAWSRFFDIQFSE